jgi:uncharacterized protein with NAD-binding domain and iron-sulfur cluster
MRTNNNNANADNHQNSSFRQKKLSRRNFILGTAAVAAGSALAVANRDTSPFPKTLSASVNQVSLPANGKTVLLVGGGLSGLITAAELIDRGFEVTIIEKNASLGGRLRAWRDTEFGDASDAPDWPGHPIEHGTHIVFNFYKNFRDVLARRGLAVRERSVNYPTPAIAYAYPNGVIDDRTESKGLAPFHMGPILNGLKNVPADSRQLASPIYRKLMAFDANNAEEVAYLDSISMAQWCRDVGIPDEVVHASLDPFMDMGNFYPADKTSALLFHRVLHSMMGYWKDTFSVQFFQDSTDETIIQPLANYIRERGGKILFNAELDEFLSENGKITGAKTRLISDSHYVCPICGEIHETEPEACQRCGWRGGNFQKGASKAEIFQADYYLLGVDIPGAKKILAKSPFKETGHYQNIEKLPTSSVAVLYLWYPRAAKVAGKKCNWEDHFGTRECVMTADFPTLGTTLNLSYAKKASFEAFNADIIETQIARMERIEGLSNEAIAELVDQDLRALIPGLPKYTDLRMMRWDNFTCQTVGAESLRPTMTTAFSNFLILGDWTAMDHNCFLMEKVSVNAKRAVNILLDEIGQAEGRMHILDSWTPNLTVDIARALFSVKA